MDFSDPYMVSQQFMLVRKDETRFKSAAEFAANPKLLIGSQAGTTNFYVAVYNVLDGKEDNPRIKLFETFGATVQALIAGDVDAVLMDVILQQGLHRRQSRQAEDRRRSPGNRQLRLHLQAGIGPRGRLQCGHGSHEGRRHPGQAHHEVVREVQPVEVPPCVARVRARPARARRRAP